MMQETFKFRGLIVAAVLIAIIFAAPSFATMSTSASVAPGRNITTTGGNMTAGNTTSSSSELHKPYRCLVIHCV
jgi:hypothetical protein